MPDLTFVVAGSFDARTGGSIYNRRMAAALARRGWKVEVRELDGTFPSPTAGALQHALAVMSQIPPGRLVLVDGLAFGAMPTVVASAAARVRLVVLMHLPLAAEVGLPPEKAARLRDSEREALRYAKRVIVTGPCTASLMHECGLVHEDIVIVEPGTDRAPLATGSGSSEVHLLTAAALTPGKGHELLLEALSLQPHRAWRLTCAGSVSRSPETVARVRDAIDRSGLHGRVSLVGELDESAMAACYDRADVVVSASLRETFGMAVAEGLAHGLPVVATATGAIPTLVGDQAGLVVRPADRDALSSALERMIDDADFRARCAGGARRMRERLADWDQAAARLAAALPV